MNVVMRSHRSGFHARRSANGAMLAEGARQQTKLPDFAVLGTSPTDSQPCGHVQP
ncbi:hypothetical protein [Paenibacillus sacheonensis]|uniref:Uncharacterized protein n=1 Tax=Paenibacillus sacheonensis TaxID=742054 RepID=A0A7X5C3T3_9BACL|nr:hypothetical protein [Paenibacillus sacheonensis]MBM7566765.1 hypothetical protein [Paenibacillus sacheonensis]NBC71659.1 hypothetical protein [Paenibacillus sacheonensis]